MTAGTLILAGAEADFALGLSWQGPRKGHSVRAECAREARKSKATHALVGGRQYALANTAGQEHQPARGRPCYSAALAAAAALRATTLFGAFALDGGTYVVARVNNLFLPDGDQFFSDDNEAKAFFERYTHTPQWPTAARCAPAHWKMPGTQEAALDDILAEAPATAPLSTPPLPRVFYVAGGLALVVCVGGLAFQLGAFSKAGPARSTAQYEALPASIVPFGTAAAGCVQGVTNLRREKTIPGWPVARWQCDGNTVTLNLARTAGAPRVWGIAEIGVLVADDLESASIPAPVAGVPVPAPVRLEDLLSASEAMRRVRLVAGTLKGTVSFATAPPRLFGKGDPPAPPPWLRLNWTVTTPFPPDYWIAPLAELPASSLGTVTRDTKTAVITGTSYVRR